MRSLFIFQSAICFLPVSRALKSFRAKCTDGKFCLVAQHGINQPLNNLSKNPSCLCWKFQCTKPEDTHHVNYFKTPKYNNGFLFYLIRICIKKSFFPCFCFIFLWVFFKLKQHWKTKCKVYFLVKGKQKHFAHPEQNKGNANLASNDFVKTSVLRKIVRTGVLNLKSCLK